MKKQYIGSRGLDKALLMDDCRSVMVTFPNGITQVMLPDEYIKRRTSNGGFMVLVNVRGYWFVLDDPYRFNPTWIRLSTTCY